MSVMRDEKKKKKAASLSPKKLEEKKDNVKYVKLRIHGKEQRVKYDELKYVKNLDKEKLQATKDSMIQMMKRKIEFHKNQQEVYNMQILNKIAIERETELRDTVVNLQYEIRKKRKREKEETFEMQQIKDNFNESIQKIKDFTESNYELKKNIIQEKLKFYHITTVMKEFKKRNNYMINKIMEYKTMTHRSHIKEEINNKNKNKKTNLLIEINNNNTTGNRITNYTEYITKNNKTESNDDIFKKHKNNFLDITEDNFHKRNFEINIINVLKKDIDMWKNKLMVLIRKYKEAIPENQIYSSLIEIINALKKDKTNKFFGDIADENLIENMMTLPVQNKQFRKIFMELLFRNKNIFEAIRKGQKNELDKYFHRNLFGAEKINK